VPPTPRGSWYVYRSYRRHTGGGLSALTNSRVERTKKITTTIASPAAGGLFLFTHLTVEYRSSREVSVFINLFPRPPLWPHHTHTHTQWYTVRNKINPGSSQTWINVCPNKKSGQPTRRCRCFSLNQSASPYFSSTYLLKSAGTRASRSSFCCSGRGDEASRPAASPACRSTSRMERDRTSK